MVPRRRGAAICTPLTPNPVMASERNVYTRTGRAMFLTLCSPQSSNEKGSLSRIWSRTTREMQIPPGSASASSRAATFTPSPKMSCSSAITSPRFTPIRSLIRRSSGISGSRSSIPRCTSTALRTASTTLANSAKKPSPVFFTIRPRYSAIFGLTSSRKWPLEPLVRPLLVRAHQTRVPGDIGGKDCSETADRGHGFARW